MTPDSGRAESLAGETAEDGKGEQAAFSDKPSTLGTCRQCGQPIAWGKTKNDKSIPLGLDGVVHFAVCLARKRCVVAPDVCAKCGSTNTWSESGSGQHFAGLRCLDCGAHRWLPAPRIEAS